MILQVSVDFCDHEIQETCLPRLFVWGPYPYGIFTCIWLKLLVNEYISMPYGLRIATQILGNNTLSFGTLLDSNRFELMKVGSYTPVN